MKRIVGLMMAIVMALCLTQVSAETDFSSYTLEQLLDLKRQVGQEIHKARIEITKKDIGVPCDTNIVFRDLMWGDSYSDVKSKYPGLSDYGSKASFARTALSWAGGALEKQFINDELTVSYGCYGDYMVAGYNVSSMQMLFAYTITTPIQRDENNAVLIGAQYRIAQLADPDGVANDLIDKLIAVYGEYAAITTSQTLGGYDLHYYFWYGENDTFIVLKEMNGGTADSNEVDIYYGWKGSDEYLVAFDMAVSAEKEADEASHFGDGNTEGL